MRIVSLLPSATEILFALGFDREVVGVSHECDFPEQARSKRVVIQSRIPHGTAPEEIDRLVREYVSRGESHIRARGDQSPPAPFRAGCATESPRACCEPVPGNHTHG